jgi:scyllo-inositol 2-dehydrogenase (NADP+)
MNRPIRVGLIGFGAAGQIYHAPILTCVDGLELSLIRATRPDQIAIARARYPQAKIVADNEAIIDSVDIDLVVVATPNDSHNPLAKAALLAGKHVVVEKPFTITTAEADELIAVAKKQNKILTVNQNRRFEGDYATIKKVIASGMLGELAEFESHYDRFRNFLRPNAWREENSPGAGIFYDLGSHLIDQVLQLFGLPTSLTADLRLQRKDARATDNFELVMNYDRLKVTLKGGMLIKEPLPRFIILGEQGSFVKYGTDVQEDLLKAGGIPNKSINWGMEPEASWGKINTEYKGMHLVSKVETERGNYVNFYQNIYDTILGKATLMVKPEDSRNVVRVIELAIQSNLEKRTIAYS